MKKIITLTVLAVLSIASAIAQQYDFTALCEDNTLYFKITDSIKHEVEVVSELPQTSPNIPNNYGTDTRPTGTLSIPKTIKNANDSIDYTITSIGNSAFFGCTGLTGDLIILNSVNTIRDNAFKSCTGLNGKLTMAYGLDSIGSSAFFGCSNLTGSLTIPYTVKTIGSSAFASCSKFTGKLSFPSGVKTIENRAFLNCSGLDGTLTLPTNLTSIEEYAFFGCSNLTGALTIPKNVTSIPSNAFRRCAGFTTLTIPEKVESIATYAFGECKGLKTITNYTTTPQAIESTVFFALDKKDTINLCVIPEAAEAYSAADEWKEFNIGKIQVPVTVTMNAGGAVTYNDTPVASKDILNVDIYSTLTLSITLEPGYKLKTASYGTVVTANYKNGSISVTVSAKSTLALTFAKKSYELALFVEGSAAHFFANSEHDSELSYNITPEAGYAIESVSINGEDATYSLDADNLLTIAGIQERTVVLVKTKDEVATELGNTEERSTLTAWAAQQVIYVEASTDIQQIRIVDMNGKIVYANIVNKYEILQIPVSQTGIYIIQAQMKDGSIQTAKVVNR